MPGNQEYDGDLTGKGCGVMIVTSTMWLGDAMAELIALDGGFGPTVVAVSREQPLLAASATGAEVAVIAAHSAPPQGSNGALEVLALCRELRDKRPALAVVVMLSEEYECAHFVHELVRIGVAGCLDEFSSGADVIHCLREVHAGRTCHCQSATRLLKEYYALETLGGNRGSTRVLSQREREVGEYLVRGEDAHSIAGLLDLKVSTVETYRKRLYRKTGAHKVAELCRWWRLNGMDAGVSPCSQETRPEDENGGEK